MRLACLAVAAVAAYWAPVNGFVRYPAGLQGRQVLKLHAEGPRPFTTKGSFAPKIPGLVDKDISLGAASFVPISGALLAPFFLGIPDAAAKGGEFGIFEGKSFSFIHPIIMGALFLYTVYTGILGWQYRSIRTIGGDLNELKTRLPSLQSGTKAGFPLSKTISEIKSTLSGLEESDPKASALKADLSTLQSSSVAALDAEYSDLLQQRKSLTSKEPRDKHYNSGSILLALGVAAAILGPMNTWFRAGKLFPSPHLFAGAAIVILWASAAALVPAMQKGNSTARNVHIALNAVNLGLFAWQISTGLGIAAKVWELAPWP